MYILLIVDCLKLNCNMNEINKIKNTKNEKDFFVRENII